MPIEAPPFGAVERLIAVERFIAAERLIAAERPFDGQPLLAAQQLWGAVTMEAGIVIRTINIAVAAPITVVALTAAAQS